MIKGYFANSHPLSCQFLLRRFRLLTDCLAQMGGRGSPAISRKRVHKNIGRGDRI